MVIFDYLASEASETPPGGSQLKIGDICLWSSEIEASEILLGMDN